MNPLVALLLGATTATQIPPPPRTAPPGVVRVSCSAAAAPIVRRWASAFHRLRPHLRIEVDPSGSDVAMAALYTNRSDVALIGREASDPEAKAFEWIFHYPATRIAVATGSVGTPGLSPALAILVHRDNPVTRLSMDQLRALFGAGGTTIAAWTSLGVRGRLGARPIRLYGPDAESGTGRFFRDKVLAGSSKMAWQRLTEFAEPVVTGPHVDRAGRRVAEAVARDRNGIGIGNLGELATGVRAIPLIAADAGASLPRAADVAARHYPLTRTVYAYLNRPAGEAADPAASAFVRFILSPEGQRLAAPFLPLPAAMARESLKALD